MRVSHTLSSDGFCSFQVGRNWGEICAREYLFDRHEKEIEMLESFVTKERVAEYIRGLVGIEDKSTRRDVFDTSAVPSLIFRCDAVLYPQKMSHMSHII